MKSTSLFLAGAMCLVHAVVQAQAPSYPDRPVRVIVPFPPGGGTDIAGRLIGGWFQEALGQTFVIENRPGASGNIGSAAIARSPPDGYTLGMGSGGTLTINHQVMKNVPYDPLKDLAPVGMVAANVLALVVHPSAPAKSVKELIALLKTKPDGYSYSTPALGSPHHLSTEMFKSMTGTKMIHVGYKGSAPAINDLVGGHVQVAFETFPAVLSLVKAGRLRMLAVTSSKRSPALPDVPTIAEEGVPGFESFSWYGVVAPAGTPRPIVDKLNAEIRKALDAPDVQRRLHEMGADPLGGTPAQMDAFIRAEIAKWGKVVKELGITVE